jgi:IS6 family transposase
LKKAKKLKKKVKHRTSKYLNNCIESDHARFKQKLKPMRGFKTFKSARLSIAQGKGKTWPLLINQSNI